MNEFQEVDFENLIYAYKNVIDASMLSSVTDEKGTILYVNKRFCEISKYTSSELIGKNHNIINSGYHSKDFFAQLWATLRSNNFWQGEIKNKAKDGTYYWEDTFIVPIRTRFTDQYLSLRKDITERKIRELKREEYIKSLEELNCINSNDIRKSLFKILGLTRIKTKELTSEDLSLILKHIKAPAIELNDYFHEKNRCLTELKNKFNNS